MRSLVSGMLHFANFHRKNLFGIKYKRIPKYVKQKIKPGSIIIDCGANVGNVSSSLIHTGAKLYCFEPHPLAFEVLRQRFANNPDVKVFNSAVGTYAHTAKLYKHVESSKDELKYSTGSSLVELKNNIDNNEYYEVDVINLVDFINSLQKKVFLIKIDIEGAEIELLNRFIDEGTYKKADYIFVETHEKVIPGIEMPTKELKSRIRQLKIGNIYTNWG